jgi:hypothetical protein
MGAMEATLSVNLFQHGLYRGHFATMLEERPGDRPGASKVFDILRTQGQSLLSKSNITSSIALKTKDRS